MTGLGLEYDVADPEIHERTVSRFREAGIALPTFEPLAEPGKISAGIRDELASIDRDERVAVLFTGVRRGWNRDGIRRTRMRSFAGRHILSLKEFEVEEFFHVFEICDRMAPIARSETGDG